jgi:hypothetical protein
VEVANLRQVTMALPFGGFLPWQDTLPKRQLIGLSYKIVDMIRIWEVFGREISVEEELPRSPEYWNDGAPVTKPDK